VGDRQKLGNEAGEDRCEPLQASDAPQVSPAFYTTNPKIWALYPTPQTLTYGPCTLHPKSQNMSTTPYTPNPKPHTLKPTLHPAPCTPNPGTQTLNTQPQTLDPETLYPTPYTLRFKPCGHAAVWAEAGGAGAFGVAPGGVPGFFFFFFITLEPGVE